MGGANCTPYIAISMMNLHILSARKCYLYIIFSCTKQAITSIDNNGANCTPKNRRQTKQIVSAFLLQDDSTHRKLNLFYKIQRILEALDLNQSTTQKSRPSIGRLFSSNHAKYYSQ